jgi:adenine-specific DNA-methyltransferase
LAYRYIGNKTRLAGRLLELVRARVPPGATVADPMCGTASFSFALRAAGYRVAASDLMTFAYQHAVVRLRLTRAPPFAGLGRGGYAGVLAHLNGLAGACGFMVREYSPAGAPLGGQPPRGYLTEANAARLDAMLAQLGEWQRRGLLLEEEHALLRHDLVLAVNRVANIAGTYGHFWSKWTEAALQPIRLRPTSFFDLPTDHAVTQGRAEEVAASLSCDLCYLDPPYTKRQYAANYHLIETVARGDEPEPVGVSGLRPWRDQYSDFCSKLRIRTAFEQILLNADCSQYLISYSEDGLLTRDELARFLARHGSVVCVEFEFPRFRSNRSPLARTLTEYVFALDRAGELGRIEVVAEPAPFAA